MTLKELNIGESAVIRTVGGDGALRQHFLDMGVIPGAEVTVVKLAPMGDPMELLMQIRSKLSRSKAGPENMKDQKVSAIRSTRDWEKTVNIT